MSDSLTHYGVKGMRWGVRRKRGPDGRVSKDYSEARKLLQKPKRQLSNEDIKKINKRLNLEREMERMDPSGAAEGKRLVGTFVKKYGNAVVGGLAGLAGAATVSLVKKKIGG